MNMNKTTYDPRSLEDKPKWYETKNIREMFRKLGIVTWVIFTFLLAISGFACFIVIQNWMIGMIMCAICWIIAGTSIWILTEYLD